MRRKLIKFGKYSLFVSIPVEWIKENKLKKGYEVEVEIYNNYLFVKSTPKSEKEVELDFSKLQPWKQYYISPYYQQSYDKVKINVEDQKSKDYIIDSLWYYPYFKKKIYENRIELVLNKEFENKKISIKGYLKMALDIVEEYFELIEYYIDNDKKITNKDKFEELYKMSLRIAEEGTRIINNNCISSKETYLKFLPQFCYYMMLYMRCFSNVYDNQVFSNNLKDYFKEVIEYFQIVKSDILSDLEINFNELGKYKQSVFNEPLNNINFYDKFPQEEFFYIEKLVNIGRLTYKLSTNISLMLKTEQK